MSFQQGLSGLKASSRSLDVIGHNIANVNTTGMKSSRAEFAALYASSLGYGGAGNNGIGVEVQTVAQQFTQGSISTTGNSLDVAINGGGFFQLTQADGTLGYTRDGSFKLDKNGYIMTNAGGNLMGVPTDAAGNPTSVTLQKLQLPTAAPIGAKQTDVIRARLNLDARAEDATTRAAKGLAPEPRSTYGTSLNVYDSQGVPSVVSVYFVKTDTVPNSWDMFLGIDGIPTATDVYPSIGTVTFDAAGKITAPVYAGTHTPPPTNGLDIPTGTVPSLNPNDAVAVGGTGFLLQQITLDLGDTSTAITQYGTAFAVSDLTQDGYTAGELTGLNIGEDGVVLARYSNGQSLSAGLVKLADFRNVQGLAPIGGNAWAETFASGLPVQGEPGIGKFGALRAGALEDSNVDLTKELVDMMTAQRAYQANAQTIKTQDQVMSTLVNLR